MNVLERKKLISRSLGITKSRSLLVRYRRTYVLKKTMKSYLKDNNYPNIAKIIDLKYVFVDIYTKYTLLD